MQRAFLPPVRCICAHLQQPPSIPARRWIATTSPLIPEQSSSTVPSPPPTASTSASASAASQHDAEHASPLLAELQQARGYSIGRTSTHLGLPVYTKLGKGGSQRSIVIKRVSGDLEACAEDLVSAFGRPVTVNIRTGRVTLADNSRQLSAEDVKAFLEGMGH